jgi:hypothetical protein
MHQNKHCIIPASTSGSAEIRSIKPPLEVRPYSSSEVQRRFQQLSGSITTSYTTNKVTRLRILANRDLDIPGIPEIFGKLKEFPQQHKYSNIIAKP